IVGSPIPQTYGEALEAQRKAVPTDAEKAAGGLGGGGFGRTLRRDVVGGAAPAPSAPPPAAGEPASDRPLAEAMADGIAAQAAGSERGELFEYAVKQPVSLPKGQAAMVPIIGESVEGTTVSIFDASSDA